MSLDKPKAEEVACPAKQDLVRCLGAQAGGEEGEELAEMLLRTGEVAGCPENGRR